MYIRALGHRAKATLVFLHASRFTQQNASRNRDKLSCSFPGEILSRTAHCLRIPTLYLAVGRQPFHNRIRERSARNTRVGPLSVGVSDARFALISGFQFDFRCVALYFNRGVKGL
jgi:hypothetical protein